MSKAVERAFFKICSIGGWGGVPQFANPTKYRFFLVYINFVEQSGHVEHTSMTNANYIEWTLFMAFIVTSTE